MAKEKKKKTKKEKLPQYYMSATNMKVLNYKVYYMSVLERLLYSIIGLAAGVAIGLLFYGGLGKDMYGNSTRVTYICDVVISLIVGVFAMCFFVSQMTISLQNKRKIELRRQFSDMLEAFATSLNSGRNVTDSFAGVGHDIKLQYGKDSYMAYEISVILAGINNNIPIEELLMDFGVRSGIADIENFARVFKISYRKGGNMKDIIKNTHKIIKDKTEVEMEINSLVAANKMEQNIMIALPVMLVAVIKMMSPEFAANFATPAGIFSTTFAIICFVIAYKVGQKILDIKI